jgi:hypothetical protein
MHDAGGIAVFDDGNDIKTDTFLWIVNLEEMRSRTDKSLLFGHVNGAFRIPEPDGFPGFDFDGNQAAKRISCHQVNFTFPCAEIAVQDLITEFLQESFCRFLTPLTELKCIHAAINSGPALEFVR